MPRVMKTGYDRGTERSSEIHDKYKTVYSYLKGLCDAGIKTISYNGIRKIKNYMKLNTVMLEKNIDYMYNLLTQFYGRE